MSNAKRYAVVQNCSGEEWLVSIYDDYEKACGAVVVNALRHLDTINESLADGEETIELGLSWRTDDFSGAYTEIKAHYPETTHNDEYTDHYKIFFDKERDDNESD